MTGQFAYSTLLFGEIEVQANDFSRWLLTVSTLYIIKESKNIEGQN